MQIVSESTHLPLWATTPPASAPGDDFRPWLELYLAEGGARRGASWSARRWLWVRAPHEQAPIANTTTPPDSTLSSCSTG